MHPGAQAWEFPESVLEAIRSVRWHWRRRPGGHTPLGGFLAAVRLEFNEPDLNAAGGYLRVAPGDVVEVVYVGSEEDEEEQGWVFVAKKQTLRASVTQRISDGCRSSFCRKRGLKAVAQCCCGPAPCPVKRCSVQWQRGLTRPWTMAETSQESLPM